MRDVDVSEDDLQDWGDAYGEDHCKPVPRKPRAANGSPVYRRKPGARPLSEVMAEADARTAYVLEQRRTRTLQSIATELGITRERVRQIEIRAQRMAERRAKAEQAAVQARGGGSLH